MKAATKKKPATKKPAPKKRTKSFEQIAKEWRADRIRDRADMVSSIAQYSDAQLAGEIHDYERQLNMHMMQVTNALLHLFVLQGEQSVRRAPEHINETVLVRKLAKATSFKVAVAKGGAK